MLHKYGSDKSNVKSAASSDLGTTANLCDIKIFDFTIKGLKDRLCVTVNMRVCVGVVFARSVSLTIFLNYGSKRS
jgi:hypothetical protein